MKASIRWFIVVLLMVAAMAAWQGGRVVFAAPGAAPSGATAGDTPVVKKTMDDYLSFVYAQMPQVQRDQISRNDFIKLNHAMQEAMLRQVEKMAQERGGAAARSATAMREQMQAQLARVDWNKKINELKAMELKEKLVALPQFDPAMQDRPVMASSQAQYDSMPDQVKEQLSYEQFQKLQRAALAASGLGDTATWGDVNDRQAEQLDEMLEKVRSGEEIDLTQMMKRFSSAMEALGAPMAVQMSAPPVARAAGEDTGTVTRIIEISPLVTVSLRGGHSFDGYLLTRETMGKDPARYIGIRPANFGSTGVFTGVMVVPRGDIGRISFFDDEVSERKDFSLPEYIRTYMTVTENAPA